MLRALCFLAVTAALVAGCGGESRTYTPEQAREAFEREGFALLTAPEQSGLGEDTYVSDPVAFAVTAWPDSEADELWSAGELTAVARRANVVVLAIGSSIDGKTKERIGLALEGLPDSTAAVETSPG